MLRWTRQDSHEVMKEQGWQHDYLSREGDRIFAVSTGEQEGIPVISVNCLDHSEARIFYVYVVESQPRVVTWDGSRPLFDALLESPGNLPADILKRVRSVGDLLSRETSDSTKQLEPIADSEQ